MKLHPYIFIIFSLLLQQNTLAQIKTLTLIPNSDLGMDALIDSREPIRNLGNNHDLAAWAWTLNGDLTIARGLLKFNFIDSLPAGCIILSAKLNLYCNINSSVAQLQAGDNQSYLERVIQPWDEGVVVWNTQPSTTPSSRITLAKSSSKTQDYLNIDITSFVKHWYDNPSENHGMMIRLLTESTYRTMLFASSDHSDPAKRPQLIIEYQLQNEPKKITSNKLFLCSKDTATLTVTGQIPDKTTISLTKNLSDSLSGNRLTPSGTIPGEYICYLLDSASNVLDSVVIRYAPDPGKILPSDTLNCSSAGIELNAAAAFADNYLWSNGDASFKTTFSSPGLHYVTMKTGPCIYRDSTRIRSCDLKLIASKHVLCENDSVLLTITGNDTIGRFIIRTSAPLDTLARNSNKLMVYTPLPASETFILADENGKHRDSVTISYFPRPGDVIWSDSILCDSNPYITVDGTVPGNPYYTWNDGSPDPVKNLMWPGVYTLTYNFEGCIYKDEITIDLCPKQRDFMIPNVFTPNRDGINDEFIIESRFKQYEVEIFNRWGLMVFQTYKYAGWDGGDLPEGVYYFTLRYTDALDRSETITGTVTLKR